MSEKRLQLVCFLLLPQLVLKSVDVKYTVVNLSVIKYRIKYLKILDTRINFSQGITVYVEYSHAVYLFGMSN